MTVVGEYRSEHVSVSLHRRCIAREAMPVLSRAAVYLFVRISLNTVVAVLDKCAAINAGNRKIQKDGKGGYNARSVNKEGVCSPQDTRGGGCFQ